MNTGIATIEKDIEKMRDNLENTFNTFLNRKAAAEGDYMTEWVPYADVTEDNDGFTMMVALPGVNKADVETEVKENTLMIRGKREVSEITRKALIRQEIPSGRFYRAFKLAVPIKTSLVTAKLRDGILEIRLPKSEEAKPNKIIVL
ncbi:MAG: Hsp20/alpha crystallin family protein [Elusimicrobiales bacterium]|nr:Hsp20/alpha crystallin family protein [Elusimicrobiales bacterium]